jgi:hypothetical protein
LGIILFIVLALISIGCFWEGKGAERRGLKLTLSLLLSAQLPVILEGSLEGLVLTDKLDGLFMYFLLYAFLPSIIFAIIQLLLYKIQLFND